MKILQREDRSRDGLGPVGAVSVTVTVTPAEPTYLYNNYFM